MPGGRIVLDLPGPASPPFEALAESMRRHFMAAGGDFVERVFSLHDPAAVKELLADAGFRKVEVRAAARPLSLPAPREFLWQYVGSTPRAARCLAPTARPATHLSRMSWKPGYRSLRATAWRSSSLWCSPGHSDSARHALEAFRQPVCDRDATAVESFLEFSPLGPDPTDVGEILNAQSP
jgi:hypothetical protein